MEGDNDCPSEINSYYVDEVINTNILDLSKKRKLQAEQLGLPLPKHKCCDRSLSAQYVTVLDENRTVGGYHVCVVKGRKGGAIDDGSEAESAKDSNSFTGECDSPVSVYGKAKIDQEDAKAWPQNRPSPSSLDWSSSSLEDTHYSSDAKTIMKTGEGIGNDDLVCFAREEKPLFYDNMLLVSENLEEQLLEFGNPADYDCSKYGKIEPYTDKDLEEILCLNGVNQNNYVLSSGRWSVNKEAQQGTRKPTIDQEFEQYFSMLML